MRVPNDSIAYTKPSVNSGIQFGIISVTLIIAIFMMVWNTSGLNAVLDRSTAAYVRDVSAQLTSDIAARLKSFESTLTQLSDSISRHPDDVTTAEYLERKTKIAEFEELVIIDREGNVTPQGFNIENLKDLSGVQDSFSGKSSVIYVEGQNLLFSTPIYRDYRVEKVLVGVRKKEKMQELIQPKSFDGNGLTCIVDSEGQVVISPTDLKPFLQLDSIFKAGGDTKAAQAVRKMKEDLSQQQSGVFQFTAVNESRLVMSYYPLGVNDWILLTLVPADLISGEANLYIFRTFLIVAGVSLLFALFLAHSVRFYRKNRKQLEKIAFTDPLTGGMNNTAFQLEYQKLAETMRPDTYAVIMLNVKGFKFINENFGIAIGNDILKHIYEVLNRHISENELFARGEADHFFLCLKENEPENIQWRLDGIISEINSFSLESDIHYSITILQGAYLIDEPKLHIGIIQDRARVVCQDTKCLFYSSEIAQKTKNEHELNALFEDSIENHDFHVALQPKVRLADGSIGGAEALVRWIHPQRGTIFPSDFIPLFEKSDKICQLDLYVFEQVCKWLKGQLDNGHRLFPISVNLSRRHFKDQNFLRSFSELKEKYAIPDKMIEFELTESIFFEMHQIELVKNAINQIHRHGFLCSLDDFGVGFSSLALLNKFDVDTIKLDRQFFGDITNEKTQNVVASFIDLADKLKIHIVAEGIETEEQLNYLRAMHCDMVQGYIFSKPLPIADFEKWCDNMQKTSVSN